MICRALDLLDTCGISLGERIDDRVQTLIGFVGKRTTFGNSWVGRKRLKPADFDDDPKANQTKFAKNWT